MAEWGASANPATGHAQAFVVDNSEAGNMSLLNPAGSPNQPNARADETGPAASKEDQPKMIASRACLSCRRLKMKCVVEAGPSCTRCVKAGRQCEFPRPGQILPTQPRRRPKPQNPDTAGHAQRSHSGRNMTDLSRPHSDNQVHQYNNGSISNSYSTPSWTPITPEPSTAGGPKKASELPSVYSATLATIANESRSLAGKNASPKDHQPPAKRRRTGGHMPEAGDAIDDSISERDMEQLLEIFQERILGFISILGPEDFEDISVMLTERKALVQCICYVTARFVPGGSAIRDKLFRPISDLLLGISETQRTTASHSLGLLQGLIVLYAYAQAVPTTIEGSQSPPKDLLYWRIKTFTEAHAIQLFLHRSIEGLRVAVAFQEPHISTSYCYKMYTYWLWLYTMSHHGSLATRTPPSIHADASIRAASKLLNEIGMNSRISRLLEEVELCLSWERASIQETDLGEWWCQPEPRTTAHPTNQESLDEIQAALNQWAHKWSALIATSSHQGSGIDYHIRFTQFCITTYSIRPIKADKYGTMALLPSQKDAIAKCVEAASHVLVWALDLGPVAKDRLRYLCDFGFVMLSFCSFFILQAFQAFGPAIPNSDEYLDTVAEAAQLMTELAMDSKHAPAVYGRSILLLLEKVRDPEARQSQLESNNFSQSSAVSNRSRGGMVSDTQGVVGHDPSSFVPDQTWDFTSLFPDMLWN